ncbi:MAG: NUDIX domain-containing protein [Kofleriaceae bacterium]|nr:NUDIX domain-containing protein [Kofleriaceae bacterium]
MAQLVRDTFCSFCGSAYPAPLVYPRTCQTCKTQVWANPIPVCVVLVPLVEAGESGLLVIRRAIPPGIGKLALVGGFLEEHETWQTGAAREVFEETGIEIDPSGLSPFYFVSSAPKPNRVLMFSIAQPIDVASLAPFTPDPETSERGIIYGAGGLDEEFAFGLHTEAARRYFADRGVDRPHRFSPR